MMETISTVIGTEGTIKVICVKKCHYITQKSTNIHNYTDYQSENWKDVFAVSPQVVVFLFDVMIRSETRKS